jgi:putative transcription factor
MACEMCGRPLPIVATIVVEGARMSVCAGCQRFGKVVQPPASAAEATPGRSMEEGLRRRQTRMADKPVKLETEEAHVADFGTRVRKAREAKRLTTEDLARAINEKKSVIHKVEAGTFFPDPVVTAKFERALGISLREKVEEVHVEKRRASGGMTIGDLIKMQKE